MTTFSPELWRARAWNRYQRTSKRAKTEHDVLLATSVWWRDCTAIVSLERLVTWCRERGIDVAFTRREAGIYVPWNKRIRISGRLAPEKQVFFLLHECGHYLIGTKEKHERFGMGYSQDDPDVKRTFHHRCDIIDEEYEAWHRGLRLAARLGLTVDKERFDLTRTQMLRTYFVWALRVKGHGSDDEDDDETMA